MLKLVKLFFMSACAVVLFAGCMTTGSSTVSQRTFTQSSPAGNGMEVAKLVEGDVIEISVEVDGVMEVASHRSEVNHSGAVTLPLVGDVKVGGRALENARIEIARSYRAFFVNEPVIMISMVEDLTEGEWGYVMVSGCVSREGRVRIPSSKGIKLTSAIQEAGGFSASAKRTDIRVSRTEADGRKMKVNINYDEIGKAGKIEADIDLKDGDIIYVPERIF